MSTAIVERTAQTHSTIGTRGVYRIIVQAGEPEYAYRHGTSRRGFSEVVKLCKMLHAVKADYTVSWDTLETGVLILFTIARKPAKVTKRSAPRRKVAKVCPSPEYPAVDKLNADIAKQHAHVVELFARRRSALLPEDLTHVSAADGHAWHTRQTQQQRIGHALAKWFAAEERPRNARGYTEPNYKTLDAIFGRAVRRRSALPTHYNGNYKAYLIFEAQYGSDVYTCHAAYDHFPEAGYIAHCIAELAYVREMRKLALEVSQ